MPTQDERKDIQDQFDQNKRRAPTTLADLLNVDEKVDEARGVLRDVVGVFSEIPGAIGDLFNRIKMGNEKFTTGRVVEEAQQLLRENNNEEGALLLQKRLADNPNIAEEELTIQDLADMGIDMSEGRTEIIGEAERPEDDSVGVKFGQQRTREFEYDSIDAEGNADMSERTTRDMNQLDALLDAAESDQEERWAWVPKDVRQTSPPDPEVKQIQSALQEVGIEIGDDGVDGYFGDDTKDAVENFQQQYNQLSGDNIEVDGVVGPETLNAMKRVIEEQIRL